ncbi:PTS system mannitol-specific EIICBA component [Includes: Mannitol permease IIC component; Mannitol-specific phosphotransferase enzyme IIB component; Mannitol-specific phosphotransferase enzyme IIA component] [Modestobacter italicus]|uniref:Mannitol-specific phosphotransferase enzyme IIA component n=1 Tax=Modestobacter italicus (strain DSM 44449 / CECT 9708 / BC 501) TaxID=2732864 RepID=I4F4X5_MODI5|nr:PTS mannitol transporter subunit IICBA [Modestobacter marinus]CCH90688.1 PTS system mannitol-specific EIICBA component [Includes: Mannitol permease IIC component; Mannitol-specific phosphotransferase enzyme IIB component; Mannitol-specific phosphotransferase enzyme IIA component] [Modestobacter marinus]
MATTAHSAARSGGMRLHVQRFGTFLSNMVLPNIGAFIAWGLITALFIETGWITLIGDKLGYTGGYGFVEDLGAWGSGVDGAGIVGPMITYLLPLLIGYTGGRMMYDDNIRGGVVGAIATMGAITGASVPMFLGAMVMGPLAGWSMKKLDALWSHKIRPGFEMLVNNFSAGIWGGFLAIVGFVIAGPFVEAFSTLASNLVDTLVDNGLLPLTSIFIEPAKILFLNNAINQGILTPLGTTEAQEAGKSILFLLEANPGPGLGLLLAFALFGKGVAKASAPGAIIIQFLGGIHEIYFPYVLMKPKLVVAVILGGMTGVATNVVFNSGLRSPASPGSIIAVWAAAPPSSLVGVTASVLLAAAVSFIVAAFLLKLDKSDDGDLATATADMEARKGKKSSIASALVGTGAATGNGPIRSIVFACDAGMGSSAMGASVLRKKVHGAGFTDVTVVNKAISNLTDSYDLVVTHEDLTERAEQRTGSARHVSVANFMDSPRYDEIVELLRETNGGAGSGAGTAATAAGTDRPATGDQGGELLSPDSIVLDGTGSTRDAAITEAGELLVAAGAVDPGYVQAMHDREQSVSTYMGNLLAIPHGTNEAKPAIRHTAISFVRYPQGIDWKGKEVKFVIAVAGAGDDHLKLLGKIAEVFVDREQVARLEAARTPADVLAVLRAMQPA